MLSRGTAQRSPAECIDRLAEKQLQALSAHGRGRTRQQVSVRGRNDLRNISVIRSRRDCSPRRDSYVFHLTESALRGIPGGKSTGHITGTMAIDCRCLLLNHLLPGCKQFNQSHHVLPTDARLPAQRQYHRPAGSFPGWR